MGGTSRTVQVNIVGDSSKLQTAMSKGADSAESSGHRISGAWKSVGGAFTSAFGSALEPIMGGIEGVSQALDALHEKGKTAGKIMTGVGAAGVGVGTGLAALGAPDQAADQQLSQSFQNVGSSMDDYKDKIDSTVGAMAKYGYTAATVKNGLTQLVTATKDPAKALSLMQTAADLAAQKHESLTTSVNQLTQIIAGKGTRTLQSLGIQHVATANAAKDQAAATKAVNAALQAGDAASAAYVAKVTAIGQAHKASKADVDAVVSAMSDYESSLDDNGKATASTAAAQAEYDAALKKLGGTTGLSMTQQLGLQAALDKVTGSQVKLKGAYADQDKAQKEAKDSGQGVQAMLDAVAKATNGQANAAADTWTGKLRAARAELENQVATIGQKYGPAITAASAGMTVLGGVTETLSGIFGKSKKAAEAAAAGHAVLSAAEDATAVSETAAGVAGDEAAPGILATVGPVLLIVAAVAALGVGIYELVTHWKQVWGFIKDTALDAWHGIDGDFVQPVEHFFEGIPKFIRDHITIIATILLGPFGLAAVEIGKHFDQIVGFVESIPSRIAGFAVHMWDGISDSFKGMLNLIIGGWDFIADHSKFNMPSFDTHIPGIGKIGGGSIGPLLPSIPKLAHGGIALGPTLAMIGDNPSQREAIVPLEKAGQYGFGGSGDIVVPVELKIDGRTIAQATARYTRSEILAGPGRNARRVWSP